MSRISESTNHKKFFSLLPLEKMLSALRREGEETFCCGIIMFIHFGGQIFFFFTVPF
jgi:hypothetical protein